MSESLLSGPALRRRLDAALPLREIRVAACLTHAQLAERSHLSVRTVRNVEQGRYAPRLPTRAKLARALHVEPAAIRWPSPAPEPPAAA